MAEETIGFSIKELFVEIRDDLKNLRNHVDNQAMQRDDRIETLSREVLTLKLNSANSERISEQVARNSRANIRLSVGVILTVVGMLANIFWKH